MLGNVCNRCGVKSVKARMTRPGATGVVMVRWIVVIAFPLCHRCVVLGAPSHNVAFGVMLPAEPMRRPSILAKLDRTVARPQPPPPRDQPAPQPDHGRSVQPRRAPARAAHAAQIALVLRLRQ